METVKQSWLPDTLQDAMDFLDSSFFQTAGRKLPNPPVIDPLKRGITVVTEMRLLIKYGPRVTIDEAVTMWVIRKCLGQRLPVPELFGWRVSQNTVFIYMEFIPGVTLQERWADLCTLEKESISEQLCEMLLSLRQLQHEDPFIGSIAHGPLLDRVFYERPQAGPFKDLEDFYNWLEWLPQRFLNDSQRYRDPYLDHMPADSSVKFTHADVHPTNIIVSMPTASSPQILAIIDWGQSGWYPDYWEYFKMCYTTHWEHDWRKTYIPKIIEARELEQYLMAEYTMTIGAV